MTPDEEERDSTEDRLDLCGALSSRLLLALILALTKDLALFRS